MNEMCKLLVLRVESQTGIQVDECLQWNMVQYL